MPKTEGMNILLKRCTKCGKFLKQSEWIIPRVDQYIEICKGVGKGIFTIEDIICDKC